jgi:hypothetical protein
LVKNKPGCITWFQNTLKLFWQCFPFDFLITGLIPAPVWCVQRTVRPRFCPNKSLPEEYYYWAAFPYTNIPSLSRSLSFPHIRHSRFLSLSLSLSRVFLSSAFWNLSSMWDSSVWLENHWSQLVRIFFVWYKFF